MEKDKNGPTKKSSKHSNVGKSTSSFHVVDDELSQGGFVTPSSSAIKDLVSANLAPSALRNNISRSHSRRLKSKKKHKLINNDPLQKEGPLSLFPEVPVSSVKITESTAEIVKKLVKLKATADFRKLRKRSLILNKVDKLPVLEEASSADEEEAALDHQLIKLAIQTKSTNTSILTDSED